jgi:predicted PurR-regulated permease PerM
MVQHRPQPPDDATPLEPLVARRLHLVLVGSALVALLGLLWLARDSMAPFIFGAILAYLLLPAVRGFERLYGVARRLERAKRALAVATVFGVAIIVIVATFRLVIPPLVSQVVTLADAFPQLTEQGRDRLGALLEQYHAAVPDELEATIDANVSGVGAAITAGLRTAATATLGWLARTVSGLLGFFVVPIWVFYVLKDREQGKSLFFRLFPPAVRPDVLAVVGIMDSVLQRYIRGQLLLGLAIGVTSFIFLTVIALPYALVLAVVNGIFELIPIIGPWIGGAVAVIVTLAVAPEKTLLVIAFFVILQQVENTLLVPKIQGDAVDLNPAILIVALVIGGSVAGVWGLLAAVPFAAIAREVFDYLHRRFSPATQPSA